MDVLLLSMIPGDKELFEVMGASIAGRVDLEELR